MMTSHIDYTADAESVYTRFIVEKQHCKDDYIIQYDGLIDCFNGDISFTLLTITTSTPINYPVAFRNICYDLFKKHNLNAVIGCIEKHPHKKGFHAHCIVYGNNTLDTTREKGIYLHVKHVDDTRAAHSYLTYMFKSMKRYCIFSKHNIYGRTQTKENLQEIKGTSNTKDQ